MATNLKRTLYIGLGGTGLKTLLHTKRAFIETYGEVPPMIKFLVIDTDVNDLTTRHLPSFMGEVRIDPSEISDIMVNQAPARVARYRNKLSWLPDKNLRAVTNLTQGAGMVRTNGRVAFALNYDKTRANIQTALNQLHNLNIATNPLYGLVSNDVEVNIIFSIAGGTGSGNFIDTAYLVKDILKSQARSDSSKVIGYMVLPDIYFTALTFGKDRLYPNGCASLIDLDYLMHYDFNQTRQVEYLTTTAHYEGAPYNSIIALSNRNHNGAVVNNPEDLYQMISLALVVSAGELSSGMGSVADNLEKDIISSSYDIANKRAIIGTLGMSEITFRAGELSALFQVKAAREVASALLNPGSNVDNAANAWIDDVHIRENHGKDEVIDYLLSKNPKILLQDITDKTNPTADITTYRQQKNVSPDPTQMTQRVDELKSKIKTSLESKIQGLVNTFGPVNAMEFVKQVESQIQLCIGEMRDELKDLEENTPVKESAIKTYIQEYKDANSKFFGKQKAVREATETLCIAVTAAVINDREIARRQGAITFYSWLLQELEDLKQAISDIEALVKDTCQILRDKIAELNNILNSPKGLFEIDLTQPYISQVEVLPSSINLTQFVNSLPNDFTIYKLYENKIDAKRFASYMLDYAGKLPNKGNWETMSVEDALERLPEKDRKTVIRNAIALASPMCPTDFRGHISNTLNNYYYVGVKDQSTTGLGGRIVDFRGCIPSGGLSETNFASIGSKERIVIYHQYGVFPTFAIAGTSTYRSAHDRYMAQGTAYSCFLDDDLLRTMQTSGFSVIPAEEEDDSLELWVKGLIFGLITRDEDGTYYYKDENNDDAVLNDYKTSLSTKYRDEAFKEFKQRCIHLQPQYEKILTDKEKAEGKEAIERILADARENYLNKYSLNDLSVAQMQSRQNEREVAQLKAEMTFVKKQL